MNMNEAIIAEILKNELHNSSATGKVFMVKGKELFEQKKIEGKVVSKRSELLNTDITHWTPNTYVRAYENEGYIAGHRETNLRTINAFVIDVDTKEFNAEDINNCVIDVLFTLPTFILETPNGYQLYFVLETAFYVNQELKSLAAAKEIMRNLKNCLKKILPIDESCNDFGFFRLPTNENIARYTGLLHTPRDWMHWSMQQTDDRRMKKKYLSVVPSRTNHTQQAWFDALVNTKNIKGRKGQVGRNNTLFTLALACYADGVPFETAAELLLDFNNQLCEPVDHAEFQRTLSSAYSSRYNGPTKEAVLSITKTHCPDVKIQMGRGNFYYKHAKRREDRVRSHLKEWESDLTAFITSRIKQRDPFVQLTQKEIIEALQIPSSTLNKLLKKSKVIFTRSVGKGRSASTFYSTIDCYMAIYNRQRKRKPSSFKRVKLGVLSPAEKYDLCKAFYKCMFRVIYHKHLRAAP